MARNSQLWLGSLCPLMGGSTMSLTVRPPASVVPATSPVPQPAAQRPQIQQGSGSSAQDPPCSSNKELSPAAASARVRTRAGWLSLLPLLPTQPTHSSPQAFIQQLLGLSIYLSTHSVSSMLTHLSTHPRSPTQLHPPTPLPTYIHCFTK